MLNVTRKDKSLGDSSDDYLPGFFYFNRGNMNELDKNYYRINL